MRPDEPINQPLNTKPDHPTQTVVFCHRHRFDDCDAHHVGLAFHIMRGSDVNSYFEGAVPKPGQGSSHNGGTNGDFKARVVMSNRHHGPPPFRLLGAAANPDANTRSAVIVSCPHAGRCYPEDLVAAGSIGIEALRDLEDFAVDALLDDLRHTNIGGICSQIARAYIDVNRPEDALDQNMFDEPVTAAKQSRKVKAGYGLLPRVTSARSLIHDWLLPADAANQRIEFAYRPYHNKLQKLLGNATKSHGYYLLVDCHSMPATDQYNRHLPDIVLGDCHGRTLAPKIGKQIDDFIQSKAFTIGWNAPYSGGHITSHYGKATRPGQSVQIEINRSLYMRRPYQIDADGAARVSTLLTSLLGFLDTIVKR